MGPIYGVMVFVRERVCWRWTACV